MDLLPYQDSTDTGELVVGAGSRTTTGKLETTARTVELVPGVRLGLSIDPQRRCLGRPTMAGDWVRCPDNATVTSGRTCARCAELDPYRWMHIAHRSQYPPDPALREHLMRPHWLYVATFAGGASKVGTAVDERKSARLDEQGPVFAHWVGLAADGLQVRDWEDRVSREVSLGQVVRPAAKVAGWTTPLDLDTLTLAHRRAVARTVAFLDALPEGNAIAEAWPNPRDPESLQGLTIREYPGHLGSGRHGFTIDQMWGPVALVRLDGDPTALWSVDLSAAVGHHLSFGPYVTALPEVQDGLF